MIKKFIHLFIIIAFLVGVCVWEELSVSTYLNRLDTAVSDLQTTVNQMENIDYNEILYEVESLDELWHKKENTFCIILNHKDVEVIGIEIARLKACIVNNDDEEFKISLTLIRFYIDNLSKVLGFSVQNLI